MSGVPAWLEAKVSSIAICWRLARPDGVVLGFTSHDRDLRIRGVTYRANPGITPSAIVQGEGLEGDSMSIEGVLEADSLTAADLAMGRWQGAALEIFACDWAAPTAEVLYLSRGRLGDVTRPGLGRRGSFRVELLADIDLAAELLPLRLSPTCRNALGDHGCGVSLDGHRLDWRLAGGEGSLIVLEPGLDDLGRFSQGSVRFLEGHFTGIDRFISETGPSGLLLDSDLPAGALAGVRVRLTPGCDKRLSTCRQRFDNVRMFGGEPHVPGTDALLRYDRG